MISRNQVKRAAVKLTHARGAGCLPPWVGVVAIVIIAIIIIASLLYVPG